MTYTSALIAVVVGIVHAGLAPIVVIGDVRPNIVLVAIVLIGLTFGFRAGMFWAFVSGLTANLLGPQPLGTVTLPLLLVSALIEGGRRLFGRVLLVYVIAATFAASAVYDALTIALLELMGEPLRIGVPVERILPAAVLNAAIAGILVYPMRALALRIVPEEPAW